MAKICVEIDVDDQGQVMVGVCPPEQENPGEEKQDKTYMQPAKSVDDALQTARDLLTNPQAQEAEQAPMQAPQGGLMMGNPTPQDHIWNRVSRDRKMMG